MPCTTMSDCAGFDAAACATLLRSCVVPFCPLGGAPVTTEAPNVCDEGTTCFDASAFQAGAPSLCIQSSVLQQ